MKVNRPTAPFSAVNKVERNSDDGQFSDNLEDQRRRQQDPEAEVEVTDENVAEAIEAFGRDRQAIESGLKASTEGQGPGLKVILQDGTGAVVRQLTGEEFLRLRDRVTTNPTPTGKILDQKL